jgi:hypothetical protein
MHAGLLRILGGIVFWIGDHSGSALHALLSIFDGSAQSFPSPQPSPRKRGEGDKP